MYNMVYIIIYIYIYVYYNYIYIYTFFVVILAKMCSQVNPFYAKAT